MIRVHVRKNGFESVPRVKIFFNNGKSLIKHFCKNVLFFSGNSLLLYGGFCRPLVSS
jgi:hypothetical protein